MPCWLYAVEKTHEPSLTRTSMLRPTLPMSRNLAPAVRFRHKQSPFTAEPVHKGDLKEYPKNLLLAGSIS